MKAKVIKAIVRQHYTHVENADNEKRHIMSFIDKSGEVIGKDNYIDYPIMLRFDDGRTQRFAEEELSYF